MCRGHGLLYRLDTFCYFLCLERFGEEALTAPAASGMTAALAEIRSLQVDLIRLLLLFGNNDGKTDLLPNPDLISSGSESGGVPLFRDGYLYLPVTKLSGDAQIYKIDINTGQGKPITTITGAHELRTIIYLQ